MGGLRGGGEGADQPSTIGGTFGTAWPAVGDEDTVWRTWPLVWQAGGEIITDDGKAGFGGDPGEQAFGVVNQLAQDGSVYVDTKPDSDQTYQLFNNGKIGMVVTGPWLLPDFIAAKVDLGVALLPTFGGEPLTISAPDTWTIFDNGDARSKAAVEFVGWLNAPEQDAKWVTKAGSLPLRKGTAEQPAWAKYQKEVPGAFGRFLDALDGAGEARQPEVPAGVRGGRAVARRGPAQARGARPRPPSSRRSRRAMPSLPAAAERRPSRLQRVFGDTPSAWLWVAPAVVVILGLSLVPMGWALLLSFQKSDFVTPATWVGHRQLPPAARRPDVPRRGQAHAALHRRVRAPEHRRRARDRAPARPPASFVGLYRTRSSCPFIMSATAQGERSSFVFYAQFGVANAALGQIGMGGRVPRGPGQALWLWSRSGSGVGRFCVMVYLAALQDIPGELVEAALIDGARRRGCSGTWWCPIWLR